MGGSYCTPDSILINELTILSQRKKSMSDKDFKLKSSSEEFDSRKKDIFANIDSLASKSASNTKQDIHEKSKERQPRNIRDNSDSRFYDARNNRNRTEDFKGRESIFRSPNES